MPSSSEQMESTEDTKMFSDITRMFAAVLEEKTISPMSQNFTRPTTESNVLGPNIARLVAEANSKEITRLTPLIIFLLLIILTGIPGNLLVCGIYRKKFASSSSSFLIFALAAVDLTGCFVVILEVGNVVQQYTFTEKFLCKTTIFFELWTILTSGCLLLVISVDRFRKVCHPFDWQLSVRTAKVLLAVASSVALFCSWPALFLFGITRVNTHVSNLEGTECSILEEYRGSVYLQIFNGMFLLLFVFSITILTVLYSMICTKVMRHEKMVVTSVKCNDKQHESNTELENDRYNDTKPKRSLSTTPSQQNFQRKTSEFRLMQMFRASPLGSKATARLTLTMCVISVFFIVSFLPYTTLRLLEVFQNRSINSMSTDQRAVCKTFLRTYFLNCAINPFIYCACSSKFRRDLKAYCKRFC